MQSKSFKSVLRGNKKCSKETGRRVYNKHNIHNMAKYTKIKKKSRKVKLLDSTEGTRRCEDQEIYKGVTCL